MGRMFALIAAAALGLGAAGAAWDGDAAAQDAAETSKAAPATAPLQAASLNKVQSRLGFRLIAEMARQEKGDGNLIVSPASLAAVLALLDLGANAEMRAGLFKALAFEKSSPKPRRASLRRCAPASRPCNPTQAAR